MQKSIKKTENLVLWGKKMGTKMVMLRFVLWRHSAQVVTDFKQFYKFNSFYFFLSLDFIYFFRLIFSLQKIIFWMLKKSYFSNSRTIYGLSVTELQRRSFIIRFSRSKPKLNHPQKCFLNSRHFSSSHNFDRTFFPGKVES